MTRRALLAAAALALGTHPAWAPALSDERMKRVGVVVYKFTGGDGYVALFDQAMRERGWIEGRNVVYERRIVVLGDDRALSDCMAELVALDVDVIHVFGARAALAAKSATQRIPIVFMVGDAVGRGVVANLARPEANVTGVSGRFVEETAKRLELLTQIAPRTSRVAALQNTDLGIPPALFRDPKPPRGVEVFIVPLRGEADLPPAMEAAARGGATAILVAQIWPRPFSDQIVGAIARTRLPAIYQHRDFVESGGLVSLGAQFQLGRVAAYVDRILRGAKPSELPVEQDLVLELAINLRTAQAIGITIPQELIVRADWIVE